MIQKYQNDPNSYHLFAMYLKSREKLDQEFSIIKKGLEIAPNDNTLLGDLSSALRRKGDNQKAIETAERNEKANPESLGAKFLLASLYQESGNAENATQLYEAILERNPNHVPALNNLAILASKKGDFDKAEQLARKATSLLPNNGLILDTLGWILYQEKEHKEAGRGLGKGGKT